MKNEVVVAESMLTISNSNLARSTVWKFIFMLFYWYIY